VAQTVLQEMYETGEDPSRIIDEKNLAQMSDTGELESIVEGVLEKINSRWLIIKPEKNGH